MRRSGEPLGHRANCARAQNDIGTALYRAYLQRLIPEVRAMRAEIDAEAEGFPDLLAWSADVLRDIWPRRLAICRIGLGR